MWGCGGLANALADLEAQGRGSGLRLQATVLAQRWAGHAPPVTLEAHSMAARSLHWQFSQAKGPEKSCFDSALAMHQLTLSSSALCEQLPPTACRKSLTWR